MAPDTLTQVLVDVCLDVELLDEVRADPAAELAAAGVPPKLADLVGRRRGRWISAAVALSQPLPPAEEIEAYVRARVREDPPFAEAIRREPAPILQRALHIRFPTATTVEVVEVDGFPEVRIAGLRSPGMDYSAPIEIENQSDQDIDVDVDVDVDVDTDVDIDTDVDTDIDIGVIDVDVDVDVDIDIDTVVDNVVDNVTVVQHKTSAAQRDWTQYWDRRRAAWRAADDRPLV